MMKKYFKIIFLVLLTVIPLTGCAKIFNSYEDELYSEKDVLGSKAVASDTTNVLTRENAIKKTLNVFDKGLNIKIDRTQLTENIKLIKNENINNLQWQITWAKSDAKIFYRCILDSSTGDILEIDWTDFSKLNKTEKFKLSSQEIAGLIEPLLKELKIDANNYIVIQGSSHISDTYSDIVLINKNSKQKEYGFTIDRVNKAVIGFSKLDRQIFQYDKGNYQYENNSSSRR